MKIKTNHLVYISVNQYFFYPLILKTEGQNKNIQFTVLPWLLKDSPDLTKCVAYIQINQVCRQREIIICLYDQPSYL